MATLSCYILNFLDIHEIDSDPMIIAQLKCKLHTSWLIVSGKKAALKERLTSAIVVNVADVLATLQNCYISE